MLAVLRRFVLGSGFIVASVVSAQELDPRELLPLWDRTLTVRTASGYTDNVLLNQQTRQASPFALGGLDFVVWRIPSGGYEFQFSISGDYRRYLDRVTAPGGSLGRLVDHETYAAAEAEFKRSLGRAWSVSAKTDYTYQDQVVAASAFERGDLVGRSSLRVHGHAAGVALGLRRELGSAAWFELALPAHRYDFAGDFQREGLDDLWESGARGVWGRSYGEASEWQLSYEFTRENYDRLPAQFLDRSPIPDTRLELNANTWALAWRHAWDARQRWTTTAKINFRCSEDNGRGFLNYRRTEGSIRLRYRAARWEASLRAGLGHTLHFVERNVGPDDPGRPERYRWNLNARVEHRVAKWLRLYAEFQREEDLSNLTAEEYFANTITAGLSWEF